MQGYIVGSVANGQIYCTECGGEIPRGTGLDVEVKAENHVHFLCPSCYGNTNPTICDQCITHPEKE